MKQLITMLSGQRCSSFGWSRHLPHPNDNQVWDRMTRLTICRLATRSWTSSLSVGMCSSKRRAQKTCTERLSTGLLIDSETYIRRTRPWRPEDPMQAILLVPLRSRITLEVTIYLNYISSGTVKLCFSCTLYLTCHVMGHAGISGSKLTAVIY